MNSYLNNEPWFYAFQLYFSQSYCFMFIEREENYFFLSGVSYVRFGRVFILAAFPDANQSNLYLSRSEKCENHYIMLSGICV